MKKIVTIISVSLSLFLYLILNTASVLAADVIISVSPPSTVKIVDLGKFLSSAVGLVLVLAALAAFIYLITGGIQWITSGGDKSKVEAAQHRIQAAILGLFIVFAVWAIFIVIEQLLGISILRGIHLPSLY